MTVKNTPWAYTIRSHSPDERDMATGNVYEDTGYNHTYIAILERGDYTEVEKRAKLICAAQDLLEACKPALSLLRDESQYFRKRPDTIIAKLEAAISKAGDIA